MSDGSFAYHPECEAKRLEVLSKYPYVCPRTDWHVADQADCTAPPTAPTEASSSAATGTAASGAGEGVGAEVEGAATTAAEATSVATAPPTDAGAADTVPGVSE